MKNRIDYWRIRQGMTYRHIAELADTTAQYVSMLAKGQRGNPGAATMRKISSALGKNVGQVFLMGEKRA
jgi:transcriptional regulator with XRE-family HTH domain